MSVAGSGSELVGTVGLEPTPEQGLSLPPLPQLGHVPVVSPPPGQAKGSRWSDGGATVEMVRLELTLARS